MTRADKHAKMAAIFILAIPVALAFIAACVYGWVLIIKWAVSL